MIKRIALITIIFAAASFGWMYLSKVMNVRSDDANNALSDTVGGLWGTSHKQSAPQMMIVWNDEIVKRKKKPNPPNRSASLPLSGSDINVNLQLDQRKKGLLWFSTYTSNLSAKYSITNPEKSPVAVTITFPLPSEKAVYDNVKVAAAGRDDLKYWTNGKKIVAQFTMEPLESQVVEFGYESRGLDQWTYSFGADSGMVKNFKLVMRTNFSQIDFPKDSVSPDVKTWLPDRSGWELVWSKQSTMVSNFSIGMIMPRRINPGPMAASMSAHAPVSLVFFFFLIFILQNLRNIKIHPVNYFFLACGFFAFNLLLAYLVDHLDLKISFIISSLVSIFLVVSYLRLVVGTRFAIIEAGISQLLFQSLFSFAHFFEGYTGLSITIGAIITLAVVMHLTAKIDWEEKFGGSDAKKCLQE